MNGFYKPKSRPLVLGHRGVPLAHQENTMAGFRKAVELGIDGIELDVFATRDGEVVVFHDEDTERLTGVKGLISEMTWDEVSRLRVQKRIVQDDNGNYQTYGREERIPLLEEVLDELQDDLLINVEMKAYRPMWSRRKTGRLVADVIRKTGSCDRVVATSFDFFMLRDLENDYRSIHSGFAYDDGMADGIEKWCRLLPEIGSEFSQAAGNQNHMTFINRLLELNAVGRMVGSSVVGVEHTLIDSDTVQKFHDRNMLVGAYTLFPYDTRTVSASESDQMAEARRLHELKVDWIETDDPEKLLKLYTS
ncbi:glycerophosphodiester phosphodiesterase [Parendozoicomonas haliclonae]|uniref:Putative glycerophosphoryl diester phosphodiesterase 1 n=1 Tax=Parendozoicomonas haliclonae TaxID=1960125 RepID=A0A1X7AKJ3_9GAMM|nr:glycerophosphodiester phosphodiesterase family protein [Parendozoicomonas haliclonae]SMA47953.1 putative glycerophosphoryl diester phosphodiesterase 1 [Parendozoicomonas haliclonae]